MLARLTGYALSSNSSSTNADNHPVTASLYQDFHRRDWLNPPLSAPESTTVESLCIQTKTRRRFPMRVISRFALLAAATLAVTTAVQAAPVFINILTGEPVGFTTQLVLACRRSITTASQA